LKHFKDSKSSYIIGGFCEEDIYSKQHDVAALRKDNLSIGSLESNPNEYNLNGRYKKALFKLNSTLFGAMQNSKV
jgi:hypothetical protein